MALVKGVNSYATVAEAEVYFLDRLDTAEWTNATSLQKEQALITATSVLDDRSWVGYAVSDIQSLAFPRVGSYFDPRVGSEIIMSDTDVPIRIINAVYEMAYHLLVNDGLLDDTGNITDLSVGPIKLSEVTSASLIPNVVKRLIKPLLINQGASLWWRAN